MALAVMRRFHGAAERTFAATPTLADELQRTRPRAHPPLAARRGPRPVQSGRSAAPRARRTCRARSCSMSGGSRRRRISRRSSTSTLPGARSWSADGPALERMKAALSRRVVPGGEARRRARVDSMPPPTCSSSRAGPTRSAWSISKRWRAGFPSRPSRSRGRSTSSGRTNAASMAERRGIGALDEDLAAADRTRADRRSRRRGGRGQAL